MLNGSRDAVLPVLGSGQRVGLGLLVIAGVAGLATWAVRLKGPDPQLDAGTVKAPSGLSPGVTVKAGVVWSDAALQFIRRLRENVPSEVPILVNSAVRTPEAQAAAMVTKYWYAENRKTGGGAVDIRQTYGSKAEAFLAVPVTVENWARVVRELHDSGRGFRDGHLGGTAVDIHIKTLPTAFVSLLVEGVRRAGGQPTIEANPPHLHVDGFSAQTVA